MQQGKFNAIVDLQWGSCGKGKFTSFLSKQLGVRHVSSSNRPNAGHTVVHGDKRFVAKALPSATVLNNWLPETNIQAWLSAGAAFDLKQLQNELDQCGVCPPVRIHDMAQIITEEDVAKEKESLAFISSTQQGSGASLADKVMRSARRFAGIYFASHPHSGPQRIETLDSMKFGEEVRRNIVKSTWLHECAQGWALSLDHGWAYPYVTSRNCGIAAACDQMAVPPHLVGDVYGIIRPYPIRVGGLGNYTSGGSYADSREITWDEVAHTAGMSAEEAAKLKHRELTTVTKRLRRVFTFSWTGVHDAIEANGVTSLILNFAQYLNWQDHKASSWNQLSATTRAFIDKLEEQYNVPVEFVGTGEDLHDVIPL